MTAKSIKHKFASGVADGADATVVRPSNWNDDHNFFLGINAQTGTSYTFADGDDWCLVTFNNASAIAASLPQAGASSQFISGHIIFARNLGAGAVTITPATSTIDGAATLVLAQGQSAIIISDGANYTTLPMASVTNIALLGTPTAPTAASSTNTTQIASTAFVQNLLAAGLATFISVVGSAASPANSFAGRTSDGMYSPASAALGFSTGGTERTRITSTVFSVGVAGTTNPAFQVDYSAGSAATGIKIAAAAAASGVAISVLSSGTNENLSIDAKGTGTLTLQGTATGAITLTRATTLSAALTYGGVALSNAVTGTGNMVLSANQTLTGTLTAAIVTASGVISTTDTTASSSTTTGSGKFAGGIGVAGAAYIGGVVRFTSGNANLLVLGGTTPGTTSLIECQYSSVLTNGMAMIDSYTGANTNLVMYIQRNGTQVGGITTTATTTAFNTSSDKTLKTDGQPLDPARVRGIIDRSEIWDFAWKKTGERGIGVFAQDAYRVFPDAVTPSDERGGWQVDYSKYMPIVIADAQATHRRLDRIEQHLGLAA